MTTSELIETLRAGQATSFWGVLTRVMQQNVVMLEKQILTKVSAEDGSRLSDDDCDRLRDKRAALIDLMVSPEAMLRQLQREDVKEEDLDPFYKTGEKERPDP